MLFIQNSVFQIPSEEELMTVINLNFNVVPYIQSIGNFSVSF